MDTGGLDREKGGVGYPKDSSKEDRMRVRNKKEKKEDIACPPFFFLPSKAICDSS